MKKIMLGLILSALVLGGCGVAVPAVKIQTVTKEGLVKIKDGDNYLMQTNEGIINITSNKVNLDNYLKKNIKATGMFSGDILYVDEIE